MHDSEFGKTNLKEVTLVFADAERAAKVLLKVTDEVGCTVTLTGSGRVWTVVFQFSSSLIEFGKFFEIVKECTES